MLLIKKVTIISCISFFLFGHFMGELNLKFQWPDDFEFRQKSENYILTTSFLPTGGFLGSFMAFYFIFYWKRNTTVIVWDIIALISIALSLFDSLFLFNITRLIKGFALGIIVPVALIYIKEISIVESKILNNASYIQLFTCIGFLLFFLHILGNFTSFFFGYICEYEKLEINDKGQHTKNLWRLLISFPAIFIIYRIYFFTRKIKHETPYYLIHNRNHEYKEGLQCLR